MADNSRLNDPTQTHFNIKCPACGQAYAVFGIMVQNGEVIACSRCNAIFRLGIEGDQIKPTIVTPATGGKLGPAETDIRQ